MKKLILTSLLSLTFIHFMYAEDGPNVWSASLTSAGQIWAIAVNPVTQSTIYAGSFTTGIWKSTNTGLNWVQMNSGLTNLNVQTMAISNSNPNVLYCGTSQAGTGAGIYKSTNAGVNWTQINSGIVETSIGVQSIAISPVNPDIAYVAIFDGLTDSQQGVYKTTNGGTNWNVSNTGIGTIKNILTIVINPLNPNVVYCGTSFSVLLNTGPSRIYKSVNAGGTWTEASTGLPSLATDNKPVRCLSISRADTSLALAGLFLNTDSLSGMYVTTNGGGLWTRRHTGLPNIVGTLPRSCLIRPGSTSEFYVGLGNAANTAPLGVFRTTNAGLSWTDFNGGTLPNTTSIRTLNFRTTTDSTLYAGGAHPTLATGQGLFEYSWIVTGIGNQNGNLPEEFLLKQNYPNPFNPTTKISYQLSSTSNVRLVVYDINGREISVLVNEKQNAGNYEINFDSRNTKQGSQFSSGVYFYRLTAGDFSEVKTMMLVK